MSVGKSACHHWLIVLVEACNRGERKTTSVSLAMNALGGVCGGKKGRANIMTLKDENQFTIPR